MTFDGDCRGARLVAVIGALVFGTPSIQPVPFASSSSSAVQADRPTPVCRGARDVEFAPELNGYDGTSDVGVAAEADGLRV